MIILFKACDCEVLFLSLFRSNPAFLHSIQQDWPSILRGFFVNLTQARESSGNRELKLRKCLHQIAL